MKRYSLAAVLIATLALLLSAGCSKSPSSVEAADGTSQQLPFDQDKGHGWFGGRSPVQLTVPAGTPLEVRMQSSLSSSTASAGQEFEAVLDEPLIVNGQTVAARGADITGRVIAARHSGRLHDPGYLRLACTHSGRPLAGGARSTQLPAAPVKRARSRDVAVGRRNRHPGPRRDQTRNGPQAHRASHQKDRR